MHGTVNVIIFSFNPHLCFRYVFLYVLIVCVRAETCSMIDTNNKELLCVTEYALVNIETSNTEGDGFRQS